MRYSEEFIRTLHEMSDYLKKVVIGITGIHPDVEDLVSDAIIKVYRNRHRIKNQGYLKTYTTRVQINVCNDYLRKRKVYIEYDDQIQIAIDKSHDYNFVYDFLNMIPTELRELIVLKYILGYTYVEISEIMNLPESTIKSRVKKGLQLLKVDLEETL